MKRLVTRLRVKNLQHVVTYDVGVRSPRVSPLTVPVGTVVEFPGQYRLPPENRPLSDDLPPETTPRPQTTGDRRRPPTGDDTPTTDDRRPQTTSHRRRHPDHRRPETADDLPPETTPRPQTTGDRRRPPNADDLAAVNKLPDARLVPVQRTRYRAGRSAHGRVHPYTTSHARGNNERRRAERSPGTPAESATITGSHRVSIDHAVIAEWMYTVCLGTASFRHHIVSLAAPMSVFRSFPVQSNLVKGHVFLTRSRRFLPASSRFVTATSLLNWRHQAPRLITAQSPPRDRSRPVPSPRDRTDGGALLTSHEPRATGVPRPAYRLQPTASQRPGGLDGAGVGVGARHRVGPDRGTGRG